eukprot:CAMPEP_0171343302 /NCGR_PEP_ID=MMETSP0878-20121228/16794_1 /TAXON_ID=67004 /ORGANISM="Thalassiosira weissflogii, Strain CCMP1336" /LENGTH=337 /DNA_ID=CAMNT_0011846221 /DNA_START=58 /DNA_END=1071 /DNA_ORIENTATION=-
MSTGGFYEGSYSSYGGSSANNAERVGYNNFQNQGASASQNSFGGGNQQQFSQQQQQSQPQPMNFWNPATAAFVSSAANAAASGKMGDVNSQAMMNMAESMGKHFLETGWAKAVPGLERSLIALRVYFAVDNAYVKRKMLKVLCPFIFREWGRVENQTVQTQDGNVNYVTSYELPQNDENAPDLYLPSMSLLTYVLLCALCYGTAGKFDPEVLPAVTTKCLGTQLLEVIAIRIGLYLMEVSIPLLDLASYTGYKYLGLSINMLSGLTLGHFFGYGHRAYYFTFLWTAAATSYFILKVMANNIPVRTSAAGPKRQFMVLGFAASQFATCWFVSQTKFLE